MIKLLFKIFKITAIVIILLFVTLFTITLIQQDQVVEIFVNELNKKIDTKVEFSSSKLSLIRKFPMASFEFRNILIHSSSGYNNAEFGKSDTDTLLFAEGLSFDFKMNDLFAGKYIIERINIIKGKTVILSDSSGTGNYEIIGKNETLSGNNFSLNLKNVGLSDVDMFYYNTAIGLKISCVLKSGKLRGEIAGNNIDLSARSDASITSFSLYETVIKQPVDVQLEINLFKSGEGYLFRKGSLKFENIALDLSGSVSESNVMDISMTGKSSDISGLKNYLPYRYVKLFDDYKPSGVLNINCIISGPLSKTITPHFIVGFAVNNGQIEHAVSKVSLHNISFSGSVSNGENNIPESGVLKVNDLVFNLGTSSYSGSLLLYNFNDPVINLDLRGSLVFTDLRDFISLPLISSSEGSVDASVTLSGKLVKKEKYAFSDIMKLDPKADFTFNNFSIGLNKEKIKLEDIEGRIRLLQNVQADNLTFGYKNQKITINGQFINLPEWLDRLPVILTATADVNITRLNPETFSGDTGIDNKETRDSSSFKLPKDIILDLNVKIDTFEYKTFSATTIKGRMTYKPGIAEFNDFSFNTLSGTVSANGFLTQGINKSFLSKGDFNVEKIDVNETFTVFKDFGQTYLKAENLGGSLSGSFTILSTLDSLLKPDINSLIAEGKFSLKNGELVNFDPIKELSSYIELSELEDIKFSNLDNEFFIRNNILTIPLMDIKSSAADLTINGTHNFNGDYEYHVKILLSEILSREKRNSNKANNESSEFGAIADDGLGRTSLLLKMTQTGDRYKVGYDIEAAKGAIKQDFKTEKQTLKTILSEEYGWFKKDSVVIEQPAPTAKQPRFRILFEDSEQ